MAPINIEIRTVGEYETVMRLVAKLSGYPEHERDSGKLQMLLDAAATWELKHPPITPDPRGGVKKRSAKPRRKAAP